MAGLGMYEAVAMGPPKGNIWANVGGNQTFTMVQDIQEIKVEAKFETFPIFSGLYDCIRWERLVESGSGSGWVTAQV